MASSSALTAASGEEENKEQRPTDVMFLCDEWKSSKGGISTFNREFAINLAETTTGSMKIHCYVSKSDDQDREDAKQHGVNLITARSVPGSSDPFERLKFPPSELPNPQLVIGHGRKLGIPAYFLVKSTKCKWIQFVHVYCEDVGKYKKTTMAATDTIEENEKKHKEEIDLCKVADAVVAVGSRLQQKYGRSLLNVKVEIITPGIVGKFFNESKLAVDRSVVKNFNVFMFGRATYEDRSLKGYDIIAKAIDSLGKNFDLTFVGSSPGEYEEVEQWFLDNSGIKRNQLTIRGYCSEQEELKMMFFQADLVAQPSRTEGFGLVSLEAISAGIPVLVSGQSGIAEALQKVEGGNAVIVGSDEDAYEWAQRIREISEQSVEEREANALKLRENYGKLYSWREECEKFKGMIERVMKNMFQLNTSKRKLFEEEKQFEETHEAKRLLLDDREQALETSKQLMNTALDEKENELYSLHAGFEKIKALAESTKKESSAVTQQNELLKSMISTLGLDFKQFSKSKWEQNNTSAATKPTTRHRRRKETQKALKFIHGGSSGSFYGAWDYIVANAPKELVGEFITAYKRGKYIQEVFEKAMKEHQASPEALKQAIATKYQNFLSRRKFNVVCKTQTSYFNAEANYCTHFCNFLSLIINQKLNIKVDVEQLKLADHDACSTASVSAVEPAGCQKASTTSGICRKRRFDAEKEDFQSLEKKVLCLIAMNYLNTTPPQSRDEHNEFREYLQEMKVLISSVSMGSLLITVKCDSLESLEELWEDYLCGLLDKMVRDCFVTEKILKELNLAELKLKTTMDVEEYNACKLYFKKDALRGTSPLTVIPTTGHGKQLKEPTGRIGTSLSTMLPTAGHGKELEGRLKTMKLQEEKRILSLPGPSTFDPEEELEELCRVLQLGEDTSPSTVLSTSGHKKGLRKTEKVRHKIVKPQGKKGMLPLHGTSTHNPEKGVEELGSLPSPPLSTTDLEEKLEEVCVKLKRLRMEGSLPAHQSSTSHVEVKLAELQMELKRLRMEGTRPPPELFTDLLERELEKLRVQITRKRQKGSSPLPDCTLDEEIREILEKLQQKRIEELENTMYPTIISGLAKFDVSLPEELQSYSSYLLNESAKLGLRRKVSQRPSAVQKLREAMDKYELKTFLTIHIREGAWQVVLLFTDELRSRKLPSDWCETKWDWHEKMLISSIYSSASGILKAWPTECDPDLVTLCKAITNRDWKVTRLFFSRCRLSNEGLKNLSTALVQGELYSLAMYDNALQAQGLKHLCEALMRSDSNLISLSIIRNWLGVEGIMHLCHVLTSVNCKLTSLNVCRNLFGSEGLKHLCDALISANCTLTSLNLRYNKLGNEGIKPLFTILTSSNCTLTSLDVSFNRLGDRVLKDLAKTLTNTDCTLTSLVIRSNLIGDEGIKYLCKALTDVKCKLRSLDLQENRKVTDVGKQCLSEAITGTDWKVRRGLKLSRTTNSEA
ncbi:NACHT, LRR and PYD domains-containing protein 3 [Stylophora pistillata]|uniref:NACHT, LRR and PYD domains-containing protein 3 n=1 Tax=Stylophora pistillata TaxID=50429 RepID=A0A2B4RB22_STYPI|nr:NACHT, LRR and PYD domains-containing protein 3 [Stylophora pistillata]